MTTRLSYPRTSIFATAIVSNILGVLQAAGVGTNRPVECNKNNQITNQDSNAPIYRVFNPLFPPFHIKE